MGVAGAEGGALRLRRACVREIEAQTRLDFMAELPDEEQERVEAEKTGVW